MYGLPADFVWSIAASPTDDAPRLAAADWLEERGDAESARFIRVQCRLASRSALGLRRTEVSRLRAEERGLIDSCRARWLGELGRTFAPGGVRITLYRGFVVRVRMRRRLDADALEGLPAMPLLERFIHLGESDLLPSELGRFGALRALRELGLRVAASSLSAEHLMPLADCPCLDRLRVTGSGRRTLVTMDLQRRLAAERRRRLAALPARERAAVARLVLGPGLSATPDGGSHLAADPDALSPEVLEAVPDLRLLAVREPGTLAGAVPASLLSLRLEGATRPPIGPPAGLRELTLAAPAHGAIDGRELAACLARLPALRSVSASGRLAHPEALPDALNALPELRLLYLVTRDGGLGDLPARLRCPRLLELDLGENGSGRLLGTLPALVALRDGPGFDALKLLARDWPTPWGRQVSVGGATLTVPAWLESRPLPEADPDWWVPVASWAEYGDPADTHALRGPARLTLERLDRPIPRADWPAHLRGPATPHGAPGRWEPLSLSVGPPARVQTLGATRWLDAYRFLWPGRRRSYRLLAEAHRARLVPWARLLRLVAESFRADATADRP